MIDLATWNLTIPVGVPATVISTPLLVGGYQDHYFKSDAASIFFWAPVNGSTTPNASYPRSELRETFGDGKQRKSYLYVQDCVDAILHVVRKQTAKDAKHHTQIYNLGTLAAWSSSLALASSTEAWASRPSRQ